MLGHAACLVLRAEHSVFGTCRGSFEDHPRLAAFLPPQYCIEGLEVGMPGSLERAFDLARPDLVLNCIGIVKQKHEGKQAIPSIRINALFPHELAAFCDSAGAKLIQVSTDCVFSGHKGGRDETALPDPVDLYGRSKLLGEVTHPPHLTIRTSMIGRELGTATGLLEWFLANRGGRVRRLHERHLFRTHDKSVGAGVLASACGQTRIDRFVSCRFGTGEQIRSARAGERGVRARGRCRT